MSASFRKLGILYISYRLLLARYMCKYKCFSALEFICAFISALAESTNENSVSSICRKTYEDTLARFVSVSVAAGSLRSVYVNMRDSMLSTVKVTLALCFMKLDGNCEIENPFCYDFIFSDLGTTTTYIVSR